MALDYFRYYTRWNEYANRRRYDAPADPWTPIRVDPSDVDYYSTVSLKWGLGRVRAGEWDRPRNCDTLSGTKTVEGLRQRFEEGREWEETVYYRSAKEAFAEGDDVRGYETLAAFRAERCERVDELFERIQRDGYRPNYETTSDPPTEVERIHDLEPFVVIGRAGEVRWVEGYHRLVIASILDIDEIPVYVVRRHEEWQRKRDEISETPIDERPPELEACAEHPDMQDVLS